MMKKKHRIQMALKIARGGTVDGADHKMWIIDQMVRALTGCERQGYDDLGLESSEYSRWVANVQAGEDGPGTYMWSEGIPP